jgi:hypothetical protein
MAKKTALAVKQSTALANWEAELAAEAQEVSAKESLTAPSISFQGGRVSIAGQPAADNKLVGIIVDHCFENAYYTSKYDPKNPASPICFALGKDEDELKPHENSSDPQADRCKGCPKNEFGSGDGNGKACKNTRRLIVISADAETPEAIEETEAFKAGIPPTSLKGWALYVKGVTANFNRPLWAVKTEISAIPEKSFFKVVFKPAGLIEPELLGALKAKREAIQAQLFAAYKKPEEQETKPAPKKGRKF